MSTLMQLAVQLESTRIGLAIAESRYAFAVIEGVHLIGLSVSVGLIFITDLRLMGLLFRNVPVSDVLRHLRPYILLGFAGVFVSGGLLFWAEASTVMASPAFPAKMVFIALAGLNAAYFEFVTAKKAPVRENHATLPSSVRYAGAASLALWTLVIIFGRLIPYMPGEH
jgi:hypothetical protein